MTTEPGPVTEAGRRLLARAVEFYGPVTAVTFENSILAIEAEASRSMSEPKSYWMDFLAWESEAAKQGSGMTEDQMTGAALFRSWIVNHAPAPVDCDERVREVLAAVREGVEGLRKETGSWPGEAFDALTLVVEIIDKRLALLDTLTSESGDL